MSIMNASVIRSLGRRYITTGFVGKPKDVLTLRCDNCYYKKIDDRWHVLCTKFGRHKQMEKYEGNGKNNWIVSDVAIGKGPHFRKRVQYLGQHLGQYDP